MDPKMKLSTSSDRALQKKQMYLLSMKSDLPSSSNGLSKVSQSHTIHYITVVAFNIENSLCGVIPTAGAMAER